jgi:hypothetical protein
VWFGPGFNGMVHDQYPFYPNVVPFCRHGVAAWCEATSLEQAELVLVGQVRELTARPLALPETGGVPMVVDVEGDQAPGTFRDDLSGCVRVCCGAPRDWAGPNVWARPTMSRFLVWASRNDYRRFRPAREHRLGFMGKTDSRGLRARMSEAVVGLPAAVVLRREWHGPSALNHPARDEYEAAMLGSSMALCPMGEGVATARFYEACFYGRMPVVIGETLVLDDGAVDSGFAAELGAGLGVEELRAALGRIVGIGAEEAAERGRAARDYFDRVVRRYFADPTRMFLDWWHGPRWD